MTQMREMRRAPIDHSRIRLIARRAALVLGAVTLALSPLSRGPDGGDARAQPDTAKQNAPAANTGQTVTPPAAPADNTYWSDFQIDHPDWSLKEREDRLADLLSASLASGDIDPAEAGRLQAELADIRASEDRLRRRNNGELTDSETFRLEGRLRGAAASIHWLHGAPGRTRP